MAFIGRLVGEKFKDYVRNQIDTRETKLSNNTRDQNQLKFINNKTSFIRLTSGVNVDESSELAKNNKLFGGFNFQTEGPGRFITGYDGYHFSKEYGYVPPPGITSIEVRALERGSLREAVINLVCHNLEQFKTIEKLYLRLKYSMLLEWGHTMYFDNDGNFINNPQNESDIEDISNYFIKANDVDQFEVLKKLENNRKNSSGNYDGFLGFVTNFDWTLRPDGGYDIVIRAYSIGDIIESIKLNVNLPQPQEPASTVNDPITLSKNNSTLNYMMYKIKEALDQFGGNSDLVYVAGNNGNGSSFNLSTAETARITGIKNTYVDPGEQWDNYKSSLDPDVWLSSIYYDVYRYGFPNLGGNGYQYYLSLGYLLKIIENFLLLYDSTTKKPIFHFNYNFNHNLFPSYYNYLVPPLSGFIDPRICLCPQFPRYTLPTAAQQTLQGHDVTFEATDAVPAVFTSIPGLSYQDVIDKINNTFNISDQQLQGYGRTTNSTGVLSVQNASLQSAIDPILSDYLKSAFPDFIFSFKSSDSTSVVLTMTTTISAHGKLRDVAYVTINRNFDITQKSSNPSSTTSTGQLQELARYLDREQEWKDKKSRITNNSPESDWGSGYFYHTDTNSINELFINMECISDVISSNIDPNTGDISYIDFLNALLERVQYGLGNVNKFKTIYDEETNTYSIIDANLIPNSLGDKYGETKFTLNELTTSKGSFVTNFSLKTEITPELASMATIGAQSQGNQIGYNSVAFSLWNKGLTDRVLKGKINTNTPDSSTKTTKNLYDDFIQNLSYYLNYQLNIGLGIVTPEDIDNYSQLAPDIYKYELGYNIQEGNINGTGFIPLNLQLELDGLSGMRIYEMYGVSETYLPDSYKDNLQFVTTNIAHRVDSKGWMTIINGIGTPKYKEDSIGMQPILLPNSPTLITPQAQAQSNASPNQPVFAKPPTMNWAPLQANGPVAISITSTPKPTRTVNGKTGPHYGIDIAAPKNTPILAPCDGEAFYLGSSNISFTFSGFGPYGVGIKEDNTGNYHILGHCSKYDQSIKNNGGRVQKGQIVAYVGDEGSPGAVHLHWEIRTDLNGGSPSAYDSPITYVNSRPAPTQNSPVTNLSVPQN